MWLFILSRMNMMMYMGRDRSMTEGRLQTWSSRQAIGSSSSCTSYSARESHRTPAEERRVGLSTLQMTPE